MTRREIRCPLYEPRIPMTHGECRIRTLPPRRTARRLPPSSMARPPLSEEWADNAATALGDPGEPGEPRPAREVQEDGLGLVIGGVRGHHHGSRPEVIGEIVEEGISGQPSGLLDPLATLCGEGGD